MPVLVAQATRPASGFLPAQLTFLADAPPVAEAQSLDRSARVFALVVPLPVPSSVALRERPLCLRCAHGQASCPGCRRFLQGSPFFFGVPHERSSIMDLSSRPWVLDRAPGHRL